MNRILATSLSAFVLAADEGCRTPQESSGTSAQPPFTVRCGVALELDASDSVRTDWGGKSGAWLVEAIEDTLQLTRKGQCGDECSFEEEILLAPIGAACPTFVRASVTKTDAGSPLGATKRLREAEKGLLEIQDWNPSGGVVSGRLRAEFELTFYVDIPRRPKD